MFDQFVNHLACVLLFWLEHSYRSVLSFDWLRNRLQFCGCRG